MFSNAKFMLPFVTLGAISIGTGAYAQDCNSLAQSITKESYRNLSSQQKAIAVKAQFCSKEYTEDGSSESASIKAAYAGFELGGGQDQASIRKRQAEVCAGNWGSYWSSQIEDTEYHMQSVAALDVVRACLDLKAFRFTSLTFKGPAIVGEITNGTSQAVEINSVNVTPSELANCSVSLDGEKPESANATGSAVPPGATAELTCTRVNRPSEIAGDKRKFYDPGIISVSSAEGSLEVPLSRYADPLDSDKEVALSADIASLKAELQSVASERDAVRRQVDDLQATRPVETFIVYQGNGWQPPLVPNHRVRFMNRERPGTCVANWGDYAPEFFTAACGGRRWTLELLHQTSGGPCGHTSQILSCFEK